MRGSLTKYQVWVMQQWPASTREHHWPAMNEPTLQALRRRGLVEKRRGCMGAWRLTELGAIVASACRRSFQDGYWAGRQTSEAA